MSKTENIKERPILFSTPWVLALLNQRKSETRRVAKAVSQSVVEAKCPHGAVGDRLWVRETWAQPDGLSGGKPIYRASTANREELLEPTWKPSRFMPRWASRIELRITGTRLEKLQDITREGVIKEGIVNIGRSYASVVTNDLLHRASPLGMCGCGCADPLTGHPYRVAMSPAFCAWREAWDAINASPTNTHSWWHNPTVWVVSFEIERIGL